MVSKYLSKDFLRQRLKPALFWSYDFNKIDFDQSYFLIIEQVLSKGDWQEFKSILQYYGNEQVLNVAQQSKILDPKTVHFLGSYFKVALSEFRSYKVLDSQKDFWVF